MLILISKLFVYLTLLITFFIYSQEVDSRISNSFPIANETTKLEIAATISFDGKNYLIPVLSRLQDDSWSLHAQFISPSGARLHRAIIVENSKNLIGDPKVAYGDGKHLIIWTDTDSSYTSIKGVFIQSDGSKGNIFTIVSDISSKLNTVPDIAYGGGKFLVAYEKPFTQDRQTHSAIYGKLIDSNGNMSNEFKISALWGGFNLNQIAYDGTNFFVVYRDDREDRKVLARFVSTSGITGQEIVIDNNNLASDNPFAVFFDGEKYLVIWTDQTQDYPNVWQFYGKFVYPNGNQSSHFTITTVDSHKFLPFIAFDGSKYLITWSDGRNCGSLPDESMSCIRTGIDIYGRYYSKQGNALGGEFVVSQLSGDEIGGFIGRTNAGRTLGIINKGIKFIPDQMPLSNDVDGRFWISSGYDIFAPENREKILAGGNYTIRWQAPAQAVKFDVYYTNDNGNTWNLIKSGHTSRALSWTVPNQDGRKQSCKIRIDAYDNLNQKISTFDSRIFSIEISKILDPNGGELLTSGQIYTIKWQTRGLSTSVGSVQLQYSFDGKNWLTIKTIKGNPGQTEWTIPNVDGVKPTTLIRLILKDASGNILSIVESDAVFTIKP